MERINGNGKKALNKIEGGDPKNERIRSGTVYEFIGSSPGFIEKWGLIIITALLITILGVTTIIKFPETISKNGRLVNVEGVTPILGSNEGLVTEVFCSNGTLVKSGDPIIFTGDSTTRSIAIKTLQAIKYLSSNFPKDSAFGALLMLHECIKRTEIQNLIRQRDFLPALSKLAFQPQDISAIKSNALFGKLLTKLGNTCTDWIAAYSITSPLSGRLYFNRPLKSGMRVVKNQELAHLQSTNVDYSVSIYLDSSQRSLINIGMPALIFLDQLSNGTHDPLLLKGKVDFVALAPSEKGTLARIAVENRTLLDHYSADSILPRNGANAQVQIRTGNKTVYEKLIKSVLKDQVH